MTDEQNRVSRRSKWSELMDAYPAYPARAVQLADRYTQSYPDDVAAWIVLAGAEGDMARYDNARRALVRALRLGAPDTRPGFVHSQVGLYYKSMGDFQRAFRWFRRASQLEGGRKHLVLAGAALARMGRLSEAEAWHRAAIEDSDDPRDEAYLNLGLVLRAKGELREALTALEAALRLDPEYEAAKVARADVRLALGS